MSKKSPPKKKALKSNTSKQKRLHHKSPDDIVEGRLEKSTRRDFHKILIFCEGETEENYFKGIAESETLKQHRRPPIEIIVVEKQDSDNNSPKGLLLKALTTLNKKINSQRIEDKIDLKQDKIWVVFDADERGTTIEPLFVKEEAKGLLTEKKPKLAEIFDKFYQHLNIAFSNRAFEHWVLLHFERNYKAFSHTECKTRNGRGGADKQSHGCGKANRGKDELAYEDCGGSICIVGYLRSQKHHPNYEKGDWRKRKNSIDKSVFCYDGLKDMDPSCVGNMAQEKLAFQKMRNAIENAQYLRQTVGEDRPQTNPYTDIDHLMGAIIQYTPPICWTKWGEYKTINKEKYHFLVQLLPQNNKIALTIEQKHQNVPLLLNNNTIQVGIFYNDELFYRYCKGLLIDVQAQILHQNESVTIDLPLHDLVNIAHKNLTYCLKIGDINIWLPM